MPTSHVSSVPFAAATNDVYASFRIPAIVVTKKGTLLAFAEGRRDSAADTGDIEIVMRRSVDKGKTWHVLKKVADHKTNTAGNPVPIVTSTGRIVLVHVRNAAAAAEKLITTGVIGPLNGRRIWVQHSDDDGVTWSTPREITSSVKQPTWRWYATGPGHGIQLKHGKHAGRIVVAANHSVQPTGEDTGAERKYNAGHGIYSDDLGETWHIGYLDETPDDSWINVNESTAAELPDGRVYISARNHSDAPGNRAEAYSSDGGVTLDEPFRPQPGIVTPVVEGSLLHLGTPDVLLYSGPGDPDRRAVMTIRASHDQGVTWKTVHTVDRLPAAYSDLVRIDKDTVGLLYETGKASANETITFRRIPVSELTG
ncbi:MAG: sialidase [Streptomyces sp.]|jgi:sialidase-1|nr:sialidase [Streptomyces sp.]